MSHFPNPRWWTIGRIRQNETVAASRAPPCGCPIWATPERRLGRKGGLVLNPDLALDCAHHAVVHSVVRGRLCYATLLTLTSVTVATASRRVAMSNSSLPAATHALFLQ
jgi:hypothetical protein